MKRVLISFSRIVAWLGIAIFAAPTLFVVLGVTFGENLGWTGPGWGMVIGMMPFMIGMYFAPLAVAMIIGAGVLRFVAGLLE